MRKKFKLIAILIVIASVLWGAQTSLFQVNDTFGVDEANEILKFNAVSTLPPASAVDIGIVVLDLNDMKLKRSNGVSWDLVPPDPPTAISSHHGQDVIDQDNDIIMIVKAPATISTGKIKLLGLNFPGYFYTEYSARSTGTIWTTNQNADHTHSGAVSGTSGNNSQNHTHVINTPTGQGSHISQENNVSHTHSFSDSFTTGAQSTTHKHSFSVTLSGSTVKSTFTGSLLKIYISTDMVTWTIINKDFSSLFNTTGTDLVDISTYLTPGINYIKMTLDTTSAVGGKIIHYIEMS